LPETYASPFISEQSYHELRRRGRKGDRGGENERGRRWSKRVKEKEERGREGEKGRGLRSGVTFSIWHRQTNPIFNLKGEEKDESSKRSTKRKMKIVRQNISKENDF